MTTKTVIDEGKRVQQQNREVVIHFILTEARKHQSKF
jgi:hypothetical protein